MLHMDFWSIAAQIPDLIKTVSRAFASQGSALLIYELSTNYDKQNVTHSGR